MHYLISGKMTRGPEVLRLSHAEFVQLVQSKVVPTLKALVKETPHGKVLAGGMLAGSRNTVMIVDLRGQDSHRCVRSFLASLPVFDFYDWEVMPLETFAELDQAMGNE